MLAVQGQRGLGKKLLLQQRRDSHWRQRMLVIDGQAARGRCSTADPGLSRSARWSAS